MHESKPPQVVVAKNGPYLVTGDVPLTVETIVPNAEGGSWEWQTGRGIEAKSPYALCRCGHSSSKPFCDGTHAKLGWDGTETASHASHAEQAKVLHGPLMEVDDAEPLCAFARFCDNAGSIWQLVNENDAKSAQLVEYEATHCPSGRLVAKHAGGAALEPHFEPSIGLVEDPGKSCSGPLYVRGGITVIDARGEAYEVRNRVALCRCGASSNKPFCDGTHADVAFQDGLG